MTYLAKLGELTLKGSNIQEFEIYLNTIQQNALKELAVKLPYAQEDFILIAKKKLRKKLNFFLIILL